MYKLLKQNSTIAAIFGLLFAFDANSAVKLTNFEKQKIEKYEKWKAVVKNPKKYKDTVAFFYNNPHWPLFESCSLKAEEAIDAESPEPIILKWFQRYPPKTRNGILAYIAILLKFDKQLAGKYIKQTWVFQNLSPEFTKKFRKMFAEYISPIDDAEKVRHLIDAKQYPQLEAMKSISTKEISDYIEEYLKKFIRIDAGHYKESDLKDIESRLHIIRTLINNKGDKKAAKILIMNNDNEEKYSDDFFELRRRVACNILRSGDPALAYKVLKLCKLNKSKKNEQNFYAKSEWLLGFIAYRFLKKLDVAVVHFENAYNNSKKAVALAKNAFWEAEVLKEKKDVLLAMDWYKKACAHFDTFYGYLAYDKLLDTSKKNFSLVEHFYLGLTDTVPSDTELIFYNRELIQVLTILSKIGGEKDPEFTEALYGQLMDEIEDPQEELLLMELASSNDEIRCLVSAASNKQKYFNNEKAYKFLDESDLKNVKKINPDPCFISLVHSIIHRESNFKQDAKSKVGAIGLMQVMPSTATHESKFIKFYVGKDVSLFDRQKNITIGSAMLNRLLKKYKRNIIYVIAAYNCGEGNVSKFLKSIKNLKKLNYLDIMELIPIKETRIYVKHVVRSLFTYQRKLDAEKCYNCDDILHNTEISASS